MTAERVGVIHGIGQIAIRVHDVDRAAAFYQEKLGLPELFRAPGMAFFDCDGTRLMLTLPSRADFDHPSSILYFRVSGIHPAAEKLAKRGVDFEREPHKVAEMSDHDLWLAFFRDSEGNLMAISSSEPKQRS